MSRYIVSPHAQGTEGWVHDRLGRLTGSAVADIYAKGAGKTRAALRARLVLERLMGAPVESLFESADMKWGIDHEPFSRMAFEADMGLDVTQAGFLYLPHLMAGCSVDGLIEDGGKLGIWESKSPKTTTHYAYLLDGILPEEYRHQVIHNMWVTGAAFAWFTSFDPRMPAGLQAMHVRIERNEAEVNNHEAAVFQFLLETEAEEKFMRLRTGSAA
jgi:predicted phage-related endonuclease